nr:zinc finger protein RFP-like [Pelodiscus sinensis]|eukprot:XP_014429460.2 zinc finger protein RFP-like [Pelodiscus sinensis]
MSQSPRKGNTQVLLEVGLISELREATPIQGHCLEAAMGSGTSAESLQNEATCPICLEYFREPVTLECGHNFCQACLSRCWEAPDPLASCPQCRDPVQQRNLRPNKQLANVIEIAKRLSLQAARAAGGKGMCGAHQEPLKLFCEEDRSPICVVCHLSQAHRAHTAVPIEEAAQEYKEKIQDHLKILRDEREKLLGLKLSREESRQEYLKQTQAERQKVVAEFQQLRQFLEEQERLLLAQLQKLDQEIQNETVTRLSEEISRLSEQIGELEGTCHKPASEFLQDVRCLFSSYEKGWSQPLPEISPAMEKRIFDFPQKTAALRETLWKFKGAAIGARRGNRAGPLGLGGDGQWPMASNETASAFGQGRRRAVADGIQ